GDEIRSVRRVDIHQAMLLREKREHRFELAGFQLHAVVHHLRGHRLPAFYGPRSDECSLSPVTRSAPVQEHLFALLGTVRLSRRSATREGGLRTGCDVDRKAQATNNCKGEHHSLRHRLSWFASHCRPRPAGAVAAGIARATISTASPTRAATAMYCRPAFV